MELPEFEPGNIDLYQDIDNLDRPANISSTGFGSPAFAKGRFPLSPTATDLKMNAKRTKKPPKPSVQIGTSNRVER